MNDTFRTPAAALQEGHTSPIEPDSEGSQAQPFALNGLLLLSEAADSPMTDEEREQAIVRAGKALEHHMGLYAGSGCFADRGDADRARRLMEALIAGRSAEQVARMRAAQDRRMALEPGAERLPG